MRDETDPLPELSGHLPRGDGDLCRDFRREVFDTLADGGQVRMAYKPTFRSPGFGTLTDRFGVHWMVSSTEPVEG
ncbi:VOC family protein [Ovoidimarina sediminis]|uniref:hypothetical protein n=1 Tax=Ovoidimarina sediminis TaxID=3079856 RepID=UPI002907EAF5|nr:hypothetical protein [Rhodophyticola sp. MJ-SS7]MDU8943530.1 hypothetical protein [Rhodophyticola sp. MJ-SS7]